MDQATLIAPNYTAAWGHLGIVYYVLQQYEEVIPVLQKAINLAEADYVLRARRVVIIGQDTTRDPPQSIELMSGDFPPPGTEDGETLSAELSPILSQDRIIPKPEQTCGDLIAFKLSRQSNIPGDDRTSGAANAKDGLSPTETPTPVSPFLNVKGTATLDYSQGLLDLELTQVPQPEGLPYEAQLLMWPDTELSLGYFQPDAEGNATLNFTFRDVRSAPIDYYTLLGFSYVFLDQCDKGVPWLLNSLDIDPSPTNPAWQGLADCPETPQSDETQPPDDEETQE